MSETWTWRVRADPGAIRRLRLIRLGIVVVVALTVGWVVVQASSDPPGSIRFPLVFGVVLLGVLGLEEFNTRRSFSGVLSVDTTGTLTVEDSRGRRTVDLATASEPAVKPRSTTTGARWSVEMNTPDGGWHWEIGRIAFKNIGTAAARELETDLRRLHRRFSGGGGAESVEGAVPVAAATSAPVSVGSAVSAGETVVWSVPRSPGAERNRRRVRLGFAVATVVIVVVAAATTWSEGPGTVAVSMFTPVLVALVGFGVDRLYSVGSSFRIEVRDGGLTASKGSKMLLEAPRGSVRSVSVSSNVVNVNTAGTQTRQTVWRLVADLGGDEPSEVVIPSGLGQAMNRDEAIALESRLRSALGLVRR